MAEVSIQQNVLKTVLSVPDPKCDVALLTTMAVREHSRKQGIGTALVTAAEEWVQIAHPKIAYVALLVYKNNHDAIRLVMQAPSLQ